MTHHCVILESPPTLISLVAVGLQAHPGEVVPVLQLDEDLHPAGSLRQGIPHQTQGGDVTLKGNTTM